MKAVVNISFEVVLLKKMKVLFKSNVVSLGSFHIRGTHNLMLFNLEPLRNLLAY